ncbi:MAG: cytochrome c biogenesis protein CcsA [Oscillospiraceae bacterium]
MENGLLLFAAVLSGLCAVLSLIPAHSGRVKTVIRILWAASAAAVVSATVLMIVLQILCKFEYQYVCSHVSRDTELIYRVSALWSGQEGSFLLWALIMGVMGFFVPLAKGKRANKTFGIYSAISLCIYLMCFASGPFKKMDITPFDGLGLTEALKDPWMIIHPPLVFISYSAMAVLFSLSGTISGNNPNASSDRIIFWLRVSWLFLGFGILSGSIWAYRALGWGGYWAWDPIENAALVPWLVLCGYLHCKECNKYQMCIIPFLIACFGTFLARSGILKEQSAHAYSDGNAVVTGMIICYILGTALFLIFKKLRGRVKEKHAATAPLSDMRDMRKVFYIISGYAALIFAGTIAPLILNIEITTAYYTTASVIFVLTYSGMLLKMEHCRLKKRSIPMAVISTALVIAIMVISGSGKFGWLMLLWVCLMPVSLWVASGFPRGWEFYLPHFGVTLLIVGAVASSALCGSALAVTAADSDHAVVAGVEIPLSELSEKDVLIKSLPAGDVIIRCSQISDLPRGGLLIPYETKPLIIFFWIGGFAVTASPLTFIISERFKKKK